MKALLWAGLAATLLTSLIVGAFAAWLLSDVLPPSTVITIDGERFVMPAFEHPGEWVMVVLLVLVVSLAIVIALPVIVVLALVVPVVAGSLGVIGAAIVIGLVAWPLVLLRRGPRRGRATMAPP